MTVLSSGYNRQGKWNDLDCMELRGYVCQTSAGEILLHTDSLPWSEEQVEFDKLWVN